MVTNLPRKNSGQSVQCVKDGDRIFFTTGEWIIDSVYEKDLDGLARIMEEARDRGYEQAREDIRISLGIR